MSDSLDFGEPKPLPKSKHYEKFLEFFGNHHKRLPEGQMQRGGSVHFDSGPWGHFGKPLTKELWEDLTERLMASRILIYRPGDGEWTLGWGPGTVIIHLDDNDLVEGINFVPYPPPWWKKQEGPVTYGGGEIYGYMNFPQRKTPEQK